MDDGSGQFLTYLSFSLGDLWELFAFGIINAGDQETEFVSICDYQTMLDLKFTL